MKKIDIFNFLFKSAIAIDEVAANARLVSIITYKNTVVSVGFNKMKSHPFQKKFGKNSEAIFLHSEIDAIKNGLRHIDQDDFKKCELYSLRVKRESRNGPFVTGISMPCDGCMRAIVTFGIKKVFYTENEKNCFTCL
jgi:deoxycytidylate deaminase